MIPYLHGNHDPCQACELRRHDVDTGPAFRVEVPCNQCGGVGYIALTMAEVVRRTAEEACRVYWPEFDRRVG